MNGKQLGGIAAIALGIGFNIPYGILVSLYDYPRILRQPAVQALERFAEGGMPLVMAWYTFMIAALMLVPLSISLAIAGDRLDRSPALAIGAAVTGALAGISQAVGLSRWVFVVPALASDPASVAAQASFDILNAYGGIAIGENIGQLLTALFVAQMARLQQREHALRLAFMAGTTAALIAIGTGEGLAIALGRDGQMFSLATIAGFIGLSLWLIATGISELPGGKTAPPNAAPASI